MALPKSLLALLAALLALLLAGCSGGVDTDDTDGDGDADELEGGGEVNDDDDSNDAPGAALGVMLVVLGLAAFIRRKA